MYVRLAFAVAAHLEPEILLVDEVLAVGDAAFQKKCLGKMEDVATEGRTVLFISHRMETIQALCERAILLDSGRLVLDGLAKDVVRSYLDKLLQTANTVSLAERTDRTGSGEYRFTKVWFTNETGDLVRQLYPGQPCDIHALLLPKGKSRLARAFASISVYDEKGSELFILSSALIDKWVSLDGRTEIVWRVDRLQLREGNYPCNLFLARSSSGAMVSGVIDLVRDAFVLPVAAGDYYGTGRVARNRQDRFYIDFDVTSRRCAQSHEFPPGR
jgi:lipopolysaccharide transport system ATP-binding protein